MLVMARRFLWLLAVLFWQGGFTFYGGVVVPIGSAVLGSDEAQGFITRAVTNYLNLAGMVAVAVWAWELACMKRQLRLTWTLWLSLAATLAALAWLHVLMEQCLDISAQVIIDRLRLRYLHRWYLGISTYQWAASLVLVWITLLQWRWEDATSTRPSTSC